MVKISVIMPVYNDEENLEKAISSVLTQSLKDIELICIDDGSTDDSLKILHSFAENDNRIRVFSQKNQGSGKARNKGISEAKGEYIAFLDSDDYLVDSDSYFQMYNGAKKYNVDMVSGGIQFVDKGEISFEFSCFKPITELKLTPVEDYCLPWYFYKNIFKRSLLIENNIKFPDLLRGQDPIFLVEILSKIEVYLEVPVLHYSYITPNENKVNDSLKYRDYFLHFYLVFKLLMKDKKFEKFVFRYSNVLIQMKDRDIHVNTKDELFKLLNIFEKIRLLYYEYGNDTLTKKITIAFDELISKINIDNVKITIKNDDSFEDFYSEKILVLDYSISPKISLVLPTYNVEDYLEECLKSVINQTLSDIEIICINDGSTDNSLEILKKYAKLDSRISFFTFTNKGLGPSRNRGIERARGEYIAFLDTDDWLDLDFCEKIYEHAKKSQADIILFNSIEEYSDHQRERIYFPEWNINNFMEFTFDVKWNQNLLLNGYFTAWSKLHRTEFLLENNLRFPSTLFEDMEFQVESFLAADKISYNPNIFYHYRKENFSSIMNTLKDDECYCVIDIVNNIENHLYSFGVYDFYKYNFLRYKIRQYMEKFNSTSLVFQLNFFKLIKYYFNAMNLKEDDLSKLSQDLISFYTNVSVSDNFFEFIRLQNNMDDEFHDTNSDLILDSNILLLNNTSLQDISSNEKGHELLNRIKLDLLNGNFINFKVYEQIIDEDLFNYDFFESRYYNVNSDIDSLLYYIYLDSNKISNPTNYFNSDFYLNQYTFIKNSKINPFVYYIRYGRLEGKDKINKSVNVRSVNRRELYNEINKMDDSYQLNKSEREQKLIVSLTSFPDRMDDIIYVLYSLFNQSIKPDEIVLWLAYEQFPNMEDDIPLDVLKFKERGLTINWCEDMKSYKKLVPNLKKYPEDVIVTADDDVYYSRDWLKILWDEHLKFPNDIIAHRVRVITFDDNKNINSYDDWEISYDFLDSSFLNFFTGVGGILYPPDALHYEVFNKDNFEKICPWGDDIWFWAMAVKNDTQIRVPKDCIPYLTFINALKDLNIGNSPSLWKLNKHGGNDVQFKKLFEVYPEIFEKLIKDI